MRLLAAMLLIASLATACGPREGDAPTRTLAPIDLDEEASAEPSPGGGPGGASQAESTPLASHGGADDHQETPLTPNDDAGLGESAFLYLNRRVPRLLIEIDAVDGLAPSQAVLDLLRTRLAGVVDKPGGIAFLPAETIAGDADGVWTTEELRASARRNRDRRSSPDVMVIYLQFVDGLYEQRDAFGVAYSASTAAMFSEHMRDAATILVSRTALERAAVVHEAGHLLSLVNIGYSSPRDREDAEHPNHSNNPDSVMFWAVDNVGIITLLSGRSQPPTAFDGDDLADLRDVRSGRLR